MCVFLCRFDLLITSAKKPLVTELKTRQKISTFLASLRIFLFFIFLFVASLSSILFTPNYFLTGRVSRVNVNKMLTTPKSIFST